jgi:poly(3-hydroxybutyrate) depolymerase
MSLLAKLWAWWWLSIIAIAAALVVMLGLGTLSKWESSSETAAALPALGIELQGTTVSGISSGAYMAGQFQLAHADIVSGAGIIAGGPYACAESAFSGVIPEGGTVFLNASRAVSGCMLDSLAMWGVPDPVVLADRARALSKAGKIGDISDVVSDRVYLFSGTQDTVVQPRIVAAAEKFYGELGVPESNITFVSDIPAGHAFITADKGLACSESRSPYIADCDYDQAGAMLQHLLGSLNEPQDQGGEFVEFDQEPFTEDLYDHGLGATGIVFVPDTCRSEPGCRVHVAFHGCQQSRASAGDAFVKDSGLTRWAAANRLVVLFPEVTPGALNPQGCWDWWGYTGEDYLTREGAQVRAVRSMLDQLAQPVRSASR